ncbi:SDR family oxidoreductase, partial [Kitasatospora sp. NPDC048239]|uniref:SDR family oxidoreductase n=1 Tax=Kitasatospora sp. NPDC048239 TaxID=3364046 RepID=UPI00371058AA
LQAPLLLPADEGVQLQVVVGAPEDGGLRPVTIHSRPEDSDQPWTLHAEGLLSPAAALGTDLTAWPPADAAPVPVQGMYDHLAALGLDYGPAFQGVTAAWRTGDTVHAEVELPEHAHPDAARFGLHPALLDAVLHTISLGRDGGLDQTLLPFSWNGVALHSAGATTLRVRVTGTAGHTVALHVADATGYPVLTVDALDLRPVTAEQLTTATTGAGAGGTRFTVDWTELALPAADPQLSIAELADLDSLDSLDTDGVLPDAVLARIQAAPGDTPDAVRATAHHTLHLLQRWLADERTTASRLVVTTRGAVATDTPDPALAPVWGLVRAAQAEHPGRLVLADLDDTPESLTALHRALTTDEPELALQTGTVSVPRLTRLSTDPAAQPALDTRGTVLITGGTGGLGAIAARHLVTTHGIRHLLLTSRRGLQAPGAEELAAELAELGAETTIAACDAADRTALADLLATIPAEHPLTAVLHFAGVLDDGPLTTMTTGQLDRVLAPKADAAWHLHELTRHLPLTAFVLASSLAATWGNAGQANYAAANTLLNTLATHRHTQGLPATALAYGLWTTGTMAATLTETDLRRLANAGILPLTDTQGLTALDTALTTTQPHLIAARLDLKTLTDHTPQRPLLRRLITPRIRRATTTTTRTTTALQDHLATLDDTTRQTHLL